MTYLDLPLYPDQPAGTNRGVENGVDRPLRLIAEVGQPQLSVVVADHPTGALALLCPGGGYRRVCIDKEGLDFARLLAGWGITAAVLTYRQPRGIFVDPPAPLEDVRRAWSLIGAQDWGVDPEKLILMGFSAGGHLALTSLREPGPRGVVPGYLVLGYPVVSLHPPLVHPMSRDNLLGPGASPALLDRFSAEKNWSATGDGRPFCGPTLLVHAADDASVPVGNSLVLADALRRHGNPVEVITHPTGGHGFGRGPFHGYPAAPDWTPRLGQWLAGHGLARLQ